MEHGIQEYGIYYTLGTNEYKTFLDIVLNSESFYTAFVLLLLKELDNDLNKVLRIINIGIKNKRKVFNKALANFIIRSIKEAIVLYNYKEFIQDDGFVSIFKMSETERFNLAVVDRQTVIRTFKKYAIQYTTKK